MDNASNNDTMKAELDAALRALISDGIVQLRCFDHILNLSAKCCIAESKDMLSTIRKMIVGIRKSGKKRKLLAETCQKLNLKHKNLILDVETSVEFNNVHAETPSGTQICNYTCTIFDNCRLLKKLRSTNCSNLSK
jgi:transposase-like protein